MRPVNQLVHGRTRSSGRYALMPLEGYPNSRLPGFPDAAVRVLISPRLGAEFLQMIIDLPAGKGGGFPADEETQTFIFVLSGGGRLAGAPAALRAGSYALVPPGGSTRVEAGEAMSVLVFRKRYEEAAGHPRPPAAVYGHESDIPRNTWAEDPCARLQPLLPDDWAYDFAVNIFTFSPGHGLPIIETHVMEHGALILEGKGVYYLGGDWMEVEKDDVIYMAPFCPQSFYATGPGAAKYIYYKNVNRDVPL